MIKERYPVIPLRDALVYPGITKPVVVGRPGTTKALDIAYSTDRKLFLTLQKDPLADEPASTDLNEIGVVANILQISKLPDGTVKAVLDGLYTARYITVSESSECLYADVVKIDLKPIEGSDRDFYLQLVQKALSDFAKYTGKVSSELMETILDSGNFTKIAYSIADNVNVRVVDLQRILEQETVSDLVESVLELMNVELEVIKLDERIKQRVKQQMSKSNRDYYLNEQMKAIQKEMDKDDDFKADLDEIEQKLAELVLPEPVRNKATRELKKLKLMAPMSAESTVVRNYLDWLVGLPWGVFTEDSLDINNAEEILNRDHYGLEKPKERILEYLAVRSLSKELRGPIICLVGPPGVGKTSLARSIAESMGRNFVRMSMGGVHDEAEIRGHRKTYIGSMPGKIIQSIKKAGSENPVFLLDEVDKLGSDYRGDPSAALLEALDPEQNKHFVDHYLEVEFDLSKVFFITTANSLDTIPSALLDRMEIIRISGYTEMEKFHIAKNYLVKKQLAEHNLSEDLVNVTNDAIYDVIRYYTKEAGVRGLEREIASLIRKAAHKIVKDPEISSISIEGEDIESYLGNKKYRMHSVYGEKEVGVATGLAWTPYGGDLLQIEVALSEGNGKITFTGQLGDVMQESAKTAYSVAKSKASMFNIPSYRFKDFDLHLHVPEGAVPKDGPSAGVTMTTAIISALADMDVNCKMAMTGEITLRGKVLPVGGIKEKVLAAHRSGLKEVILPLENEKDLTEIPDDVRTNMKFHLVSTIDDLFNLNIITKAG